MTVEIGPNRRVPVQISFSVLAREPRPFTRLDGKRVKVWIHPCGGWGERVPNMRPIQLDDRFVVQVTGGVEIRANTGKGV